MSFNLFVLLRLTGGRLYVRVVADDFPVSIGKADWLAWTNLTRFFITAHSGFPFRWGS